MGYEEIVRPWSVRELVTGDRGYGVEFNTGSVILLSNRGFSRSLRLKWICGDLEGTCSLIARKGASGREWVLEIIWKIYRRFG